MMDGKIFSEIADEVQSKIEKENSLIKIAITSQLVKTIINTYYEKRYVIVKE